MCLNKARTGSVLQLVGALLMIICAYGITGAEFMSIFGLILLLTGGTVSYTHLVSSDQIKVDKGEADFLVTYSALATSQSIVSEQPADCLLYTSGLIRSLERQ